jgi:hypothetical protein
MPANVASLWGLANLIMFMGLAFFFTRGDFLAANVVVWIAVVAWNASLAVQSDQTFPWGQAYLTYCLAGYLLALLAGRAIESGLRRDFVLRRQDQEYIRSVAIVTDAAREVEAGAFEPGDLATVAARDDALGQLARTFERMAGEVRAREERLQREVEDLRVTIDQDRREHQVAEVTRSEYFQKLRQRAAGLREAHGATGSGELSM